MGAEAGVLIEEVGGFSEVLGQLDGFREWQMGFPYGSEASAKLRYSASNFSRPSRIESRDREMWPSCVVGSRLREMARCRSRRESLMWSASRYSCEAEAIFESTPELPGYHRSCGDNVETRLSNLQLCHPCLMHG